MATRTPSERRLVALERQYRCPSCGHSQRAWSRLRACAVCGRRLTVAVIRRAALSAAP